MTDNTEQQAVDGEHQNQKSPRRDLFGTVSETIGNGQHIQFSMERQLHILVCAILRLDDEDHEDDDEAAPAEQAIMQLISRHYIAKEAVTGIVTRAFKDATYTNVDGVSKYWSPEGDYNAMAMNKFFPQEWFDDKFLPALNLDSGTEAKQ